MSQLPDLYSTPLYRLPLCGGTITNTSLLAVANAFAALGTEASEDDVHGSEWAYWADWCWRAGVSALPATAETARAFVEDVTDEMVDADDLLNIIVIVGSRHRAAGHPDPFDGPES